MGMETIQVGFIGAGYIARAHARGVASLEGMRIAAIASPGEEKREAFADEFGIGRRYARAEDLIDDRDVDAVVICTPNVYHHDHAMAAFGEGKHVLVEKPMACSTEQARAMVAAVDRSGCVLSVGHMWRYDREARYAAERIADGEIGTVFRTVSYGIHVHWGPGGWFIDRALACGGAVADMGIHAVDTTRFLIGDPARNVCMPMSATTRDMPSRWKTPE